MGNGDSIVWYRHIKFFINWGTSLIKTTVSEPKLSSLVPDLIAGAINGIIIIVSAMALAALIFTGPLSPYLPQGIGLLLIGSLIFALFSALTSKFPITISTPQDIPIAILALMALTLISDVGQSWSGAELFSFMFVTIGLTSVLVGIFFYTLGQFKLGKLVRFIPYPVVGGFLAGTGWLIVKFSFSMMTDQDLTLDSSLTFLSNPLLMKWLPGFVFGIGMLVVSRFFYHYLIFPGLLVGGIVLFYIILYSLGYSFNELEANGYLLGPFPDGGLFAGNPFAHLTSFRWDIYFIHLPAIVTMMILSAISVLFNYSGLELTVKKDFDLDRELKLTGIGNALVGLAGGSPGYITLSETTMAHAIGAKTNISSYTVALLCGITLLFGADILSIFPKVILGGLLLNLGVSFLEEWLYDTWGRISKMDYGVILIILIVIGTIGFLEGIGVGLLLSIALFVINYSKIEVIKHELSGQTIHSNVERSEKLKSVISRRGDQIFVLPLQGFIFFGTAHRLLERVSHRLSLDSEESLTYVVFDFRQVTGLDSSTINSFNKLKIMAVNKGFRVLFCDMNKTMRQQLAVEGLLPDEEGLFLEFPDLDHGLEWCEEQIIDDEEAATAESIKMGESFKTRFAHIAVYFETMEVKSGSLIIEQGKDPNGIYFLESGRITVQLDTKSGKGIRLKSMGAGTVVGEVSLYTGSAASASVITETDCLIYFLSKDHFNTINRDAPEKAAELHTFIVQLLSDRLAKSNATIRALMR